MKKILFIGIILLGVFLIYLTTIDKKVFYLSLGDEISMGYNESNEKDYGYSDEIKKYLEDKKVLETYVDDYFKENLRATDLIRMIEDNEKVVIDGKNKTIKNSLIKADLLTLSIGTNDVVSKISLYQNYNDKEIYEYIDTFLLDLDKLFTLLRKYCKEKIIFIGYYNVLGISSTDKYFKYLDKKASSLCKKYDISYINTFDMMQTKENKSTNLYPTKTGYMNISNKIKEEIDKKFK